jgi:hypothetical protein
VVAFHPFLGLLAKLQKPAISFISVCPSTWNDSARTGQIFMKLDASTFLKKSVEKIQGQLKSDKSNGYFT